MEINFVQALPMHSGGSVRPLKTSQVSCCFVVMTLGQRKGFDHGVRDTTVSAAATNRTSSANKQMYEDAASQYGQIVDHLGYDSLIKRLASGEECLNDATPWTQTPYPQGFPPALIPLYVESSGRFIGLWRHWGFVDREPCFVSFAGVTISGEPRMAFQLATSTAQLAYHYFIDVLDGTGFEVNDKVSEDASAWGFDDLETLLRIMEEYPREPHLLALDAFRRNPPLTCYRTKMKAYAGDFPNVRLVEDTAARYSASSYEVHSWHQTDEYELRRLVAGDPTSPIWHRVEDQKPAFESLMADGDYAGAWMSLNSIGWNLADAHRAIADLEPHNSDPNFRSLARAWRAAASDSFAYY